MFLVGVVPSDPRIWVWPWTGPAGPASGEIRPGQSGPSREERSLTLKEVTRTPTFWTVSLFLVSSATAGAGLHLVPHLTEQGVDAKIAVAAISVMAASGAVGSLLAGAAADRASPRWLMFGLYLVGAVALGIMVVADNLFETYLFAVLLGLSSSGINALTPIMWAGYYGRGALGAIYGVSRAAQVSGFATGPLASGIVYDATGSYEAAFAGLACVAVGASLLVASVRKPSVTA